MIFARRIPDLKDFSALSALEQALLSLMTLTPNGLTRAELAKSLRVLKITIEGKPATPLHLEPLLKRLYQKGWLAGLEQSPVQPIGIAPPLRNPLLLQLSAHPLWFGTVADCFGSHWGEEFGYLEQTLWLSLMTGNLEIAQFKLRELMKPMQCLWIPKWHPLPLLFSDEAGKTLFLSFPAAQRCLLVSDWLEQANQFLLGGIDTDGAYALALELYLDAQIPPKARAHLGLQLLLQCFWRGNWPLLKKLAELPELFELAEALQQLLTAHPQEALFFLETWQKTWRKQSSASKSWRRL